jgi:hypothetical protein
MSNDRERGNFSIRIIVLVGVILMCLTVLWKGSSGPNGPFAQEPVHEAEDIQQRGPSPQEIKARAIAIAEVERREGWSGKVIVSPQEATTFYVFVEREAHEDPGTRHIREVDIDLAGKVLHYRTAGPSDLPGLPADH